MFDSEEEAARAYDKKAREEKGGKTLTNFENGGEDDYGGFNMGPNRSPYGYGDEDENENGGEGPGSNIVGNSNTGVRPAPSEAEFGTSKRLKTEDHEYGGNAKRLDYQSTTENMRILWDRHCQIAQRLLLAKAAQAKLQEFQATAPDSEKATILKSLNEEIVLLVVVKAQLEEAVSRCYLLGLDLNTSSGMPPVVVPAVALPQSSASFAATAVPSELAPYSIPQHIDVMKLPIHQQDRKNAALIGAQAAAGSMSSSVSSAGASSMGASSAYPMHMSSGAAPAGMMDYSYNSMMSAPTTNPYLMPYQYNNGLTTPAVRPSNSTRQYMGMGNYTINGKRPFPSPLSMSAPTAYGAPPTVLGTTNAVPMAVGLSGSSSTHAAGTMGYGLGQNTASLGPVPLSVPLQMPRPGMSASAPATANQQQQYTYVQGSVSASTFFPAPPSLPTAMAAPSIAASTPAPPVPVPATTTLKAPLNGGSPALNGLKDSANAKLPSQQVNSGPPAAPTPVPQTTVTKTAGTAVGLPPVSPNVGNTAAPKTATATTTGAAGKPTTTTAPFESNAFYVAAPAAAIAIAPQGRTASKQGVQLPLPLPLSLSVFPVAPNFSTSKVPPAPAASTAINSATPFHAPVSGEVAGKAVGSVAAVLSAPATAPPKSTGPAPKQFAHKVVQGQSSGQAAGGNVNGKKGKAGEQAPPPVPTTMPTPTEAQEKVSAPVKVNDKADKDKVDKVESKPESGNANGNYKLAANSSTKTAAAEPRTAKDILALKSASAKEKEKEKAAPEPAKPVSSAPPTLTIAAAATATAAATGRAANPARSAKGSGEVKTIPIHIPIPAKPVPVYQTPTPVLSRSATRKR